MEQRTSEWFENRLGKATASRFKDALMDPKYAGYRNYRAQIVAERLTGVRQETYESAEMRWGTETEPLAIKYYEKITGNKVNEVGFVPIEGIAAGASPDGLIDEDGGLEVKCPNTATHIDTLLTKEVPNQYKWQIHGGMLATGRKWWDFVSFDPRLPLKQRTVIIRVHRDEQLIQKLQRGLERFLADVDLLENKLRSL